MKKLICLLLLVFLTQKVWAHPFPQPNIVEGIINWGPFVNCEVYNDTSRRMRVDSYQYTLRYTNGYVQNVNYKCQYNCTINDFSFQRFSGPRNGANILTASCRAITKRRHRRDHDHDDHYDRF